jgi:macrolide transport system ATP-binding/permease protein
MCHSIRNPHPDCKPVLLAWRNFVCCFGNALRKEATLTVEDTAEAEMRYGNTQRIPWLGGLLKDFRYSSRRLCRTPGFALTAIAVLGFGVGAATAIYAFVDATLVKPLPYREPARLVALFEHNPVGDRFHLSDFDYRAWKQRNHAFSSLDVYRPDRDTLSKPEGPEEVSAALVSDGFFRTLGVTPARGRDFFAGEDRPSAPRTTILSYAAWKQRFGGDERVLGRAVRLDGDSYTIVGVLPRDFHFAPVGRAEFWTTLHGRCEQLRDCFPFYGVARLRDGVSPAVAYQDVSAIARQIAVEYPQFSRDRTATLLPLTDAILGDIRPTLVVLLNGAGLLCLIGLVNVSSLLLVRAERGKRELAIRGALGASNIRLLRQFALEGFLLAALGCCLGLAFAMLSMGTLERQIPPNLIENMPYLENSHLSVRAILFAVVVSVIGGVLFSLGPMLHFLFSDLREGLVDGGRGAASTGWRRLGSSLVATEIAITVVLLVGAGLLTKSFYRLLHVDVGIHAADRLAVVHVGEQGAWKWKDPANVQFERQVIAKMLALPGVTAVGVSGEPLIASGEGFKQTMAHYRAVGRPTVGLGPEPMDEIVSVGYFETIGARMIAGRTFTETDDAARPRCAVINRTLSKELFPSEDAIGKQILSGFDPEHPIEVVGVIDDIKDGALDLQPIPAVYSPFNQIPIGDFYVTVRTSQTAESLLTSMVQAVHQIDRMLIADEGETMSARIDNSEAAYLHRSAACVVAGFATLALLLGTVGLYSVISYSVGQRTREIGIRIALGAQKTAVYRLIFGESTKPVIAGLAGGLLCSFWLAVFLRGILFGVSPWDMETMCVVVCVLAGASIVASYIPARRAASIQPTEALRAE